MKKEIKVFEKEGESEDRCRCGCPLTPGNGCPRCGIPQVIHHYEFPGRSPGKKEGDDGIAT